MKRLIMGLILFTMMGLDSYPQSNIRSERTQIVDVDQKDYIEVNLSDLDFNEYVQTAIKSYEHEYEIIKLEYDEERKLTRVTLEHKEKMTKSIIILDEDGNEIK